MQEQKVSLNSNNEILSLFRKRLEYDSKMTDNEWNLIHERISFRSAERNTVLLAHGNVESSVRFLLNGVLKIIHHNLESYVFDFRTGSDFLCDTQSLMKQEKSNFTFKTITKCEWIQIESADFLQLLKQNNTLLNSMVKSVADYAQRAHERAAFIRIHSAEERYVAFCKSFPDVIKYAKIGDIASFLDLTPQSLSRIRRNSI